MRRPVTSASEVEAPLEHPVTTSTTNSTRPKKRVTAGTLDALLSALGAEYPSEARGRWVSTSDAPGPAAAWARHAGPGRANQSPPSFYSSPSEGGGTAVLGGDRGGLHVSRAPASRRHGRSRKALAVGCQLPAVGSPPAGSPQDAQPPAPP